MRITYTLLILFLMPFFSLASNEKEITILELTVNQSRNKDAKVDFVVDSLKNLDNNIFRYPVLWIQMNNESGFEKFLDYLKQSFPKLKAIKLNKDLDSNMMISKLINTLEKNEYRVIRFFRLSLPGYSSYISKLTYDISHLGSASYTYINNCNSDMGGEEMIATSMDRKFDPVIYYDDTIYTIGHKLNLKIDSICELFFVNINNAKCDLLYSLEYEKEKKEQYIYWLTDSIDLTCLSNKSNLRELVIEKPIWDVNLVINNSIKQSLESFKLKTAYTGSFPTAIYGCKNIKKLSVNMFGFRDDLLHLDSFPNLEYLELFNCLELTEFQLKNLLKSKVLKNLKQITITYSPSTKFLEKILKKCKVLESFETDLYSLATIANYTKFDSLSAPSLSKKWVKLLKPLNRISNASDKLFFFDTINIYYYEQNTDYYYGTQSILNSLGGMGILIPNDSIFKQISLDYENSSGYTVSYFYPRSAKFQTNDGRKEIAEKEKRLIEFYHKTFKNFTYKPKPW